MFIKPDRMSGRLQDGTECVLYIDQDGPRLEIDREHKHPSELFDAPAEPGRLVMSITSSKIATLTGVYRTRRRSNFARSFEEYRATTTYIGPTEFTPDLAIHKLTIQPTNERLAIMYRGHHVHREVESREATLGEIIAGERQGDRYYVDIIDMERCRAFTAKAGGLAVCGEVNLNTHRDMQCHQTTEYRRVRLTYDSPTTSIANAIPDMVATCDFMSLMIGEVVSPASMWVTTAGNNDRFGRSPTFDVYAHWRAAGSEIDPQKGYRCLAAPLLDASLYERAMAAWMDRREKWSTSYALGTICLGHQREISSRRFLDAAGWFESIPTAVYERARDRIRRDVITTAAGAASAAFFQAGIEVSEKQVRALLGALNANSLAARIEDAMAFARAFLDTDALPPQLDPLAAVVPKIRGKFAHGEDAFASDLGHLVHDATFLLEVLACVLTLAGLGGVRLTPEMDGHPMRQALSELQHFNR